MSLVAIKQRTLVVYSDRMGQLCQVLLRNDEADRLVQHAKVSLRGNKVLYLVRCQPRRRKS